VRHILKPPSRRLTPQQRQQLRPPPTLRNDARTRHTTNNRNTPTTLRTNHPASSYLATARLTTRLAASSCLTIPIRAAISNRCNVSRWFTLLDLFAIPNGQVGLRRARPCFLAFPNRVANSNRLSGNWLAERSRRDPSALHLVGPAVPNRPAVRNRPAVARWLVHPGRPSGVPRIA